MPAKYRLMRDGKRARYVETTQDMLGQVIEIWSDVLGCNLTSWSQDGSTGIYQLMVRTGKTHNGSTPFRNVNMTVIQE